MITNPLGGLALTWSDVDIVFTVTTASDPTTSEQDANTAAATGSSASVTDTAGRPAATSAATSGSASTTGTTSAPAKCGSCPKMKMCKFLWILTALGLLNGAF